MSRKEGAGARVAAWWDEVIAGDVEEPHPIHGHNVRVRIHDGVAVLSGQLLRADDREELVREAKQRIGRGLRDVDAARLRLEDASAKAGVLDQRVMAAYPDAATARRASRFVLQHARVTPRRHAVLEPGAKNIRAFVPDAYVDDVKRRLDRDESVLVMRVDETATFNVRELMEEETRSTWTVAAPPELPAPAAR